MSNELLILSKSLFKSKFDIHQNDFHNFSLKIIQYFYDIYITNTANLMFETIGKSEELTKYGLYNKTIIEKNFPEMRNYVIDILLIVVDVVKSFYFIETKIVIKSVI